MINLKKATVIIFIIFSLYISVLAEINFTVSPETGFIDKIYIEGTEAALFDSHSIVIAGETLKLSETEKSENTVYVKMVSDNFEMLTKYTLSDDKILIDSSVKNTSDSKKLVKLSDVFDYNSFFPLISTSKLIDKPGLVHQTEDGALIYYSDEIFRTFNAMNKAVLMAKYTNLDSQSSFDYKRTIYAGKILNSVLKKYMDENSVEYKTYSSTLTFRNGRSTKNTKVYLTDFNGNVYNYLKITENDGEFNFYYPDGQYYFIPYTGYQHYENFNFVSENEIDLPENYIVYEPFLTNVTESSITLNIRTAVTSTVKVYLIENTGKIKIYKSEDRDFHEIKLNRLQPGTKYTYKFAIYSDYDDKTFSSEIYSFKTKPITTEKFNFLVYGDTQIYDSVHTAVVKRIKSDIEKKNEDISFILRTGDFTEKGEEEETYTEAFISTKPLATEIPYYTVLGNHEHNNINYYKAFDLPQGGGDYNKRWYSFSYGNAHFVMLDSNVTETNTLYNQQLQWLENDLKNNQDKKYIFVAFHHPFWTSSQEYGAMEENLPAGHFNTKNWLPLFIKYNVDVVFNGHIHAYERYTKDGINFITSGGGGAMLNVNHGAQALPWRVKDFLGILSYVEVNIEENEAKITVHGIMERIDPKNQYDFRNTDIILDEITIH